MVIVLPGQYGTPILRHRRPLVPGSAGGLGGFVPPLVMGLVYSQFHNYGAGLAALAVVAAALTLTVTGVRSALTARAT